MHCNGSCKKYKDKGKVWKVEGMNKVKNDVTHVKYSLIGMVCGVLVVDVC